MAHYKVLGPNGEAIHGGSGSWHLPENGGPGKWMPRIERIIPCNSGYHIVTAEQLIPWLRSDASVFEVEYRGNIVNADDTKSVVQEARTVKRLLWDERIARHFAADCAERVLPIFEKRYPNDSRPREAIRVARLFADGKTTYAAHVDASAAAHAAAAYATYADSYAAAHAAHAAASSTSVVASVVASVAAYAAASESEREWQTQRLMDYLYGRRK